MIFFYENITTGCTNEEFCSCTPFYDAISRSSVQPVIVARDATSIFLHLLHNFIKRVSFISVAKTNEQGKKRKEYYVGCRLGNLINFFSLFTDNASSLFFSFPPILCLSALFYVLFPLLST